LKESRETAVGGYPEVIKNLPLADVPINGVRAWFIQGERHQLVFFEMETYAVIPEHSHNYDQWGMVIDGRMELTVEGKSRIFEKGGDYVIPAGAQHSAKFLTKVRVMDFFSEKNRYKAKVTK
jgi:quercetin dioxygenase-like cupin family protein